MPLMGTSGSARALATETAGNNGMYTSGTCGAGFRTFYAGSRLVYMLSLGDNATLGGALTLSTCGLTGDNTALYIGTGCPTWAMPFNCLIGNDDASACSSNRLASTITLTATQRTYFIQLGGVDGRAVVSGLQWSYAAATKSATSTRTASSSKSRSRSMTRSRTRKAK